MNSLVKTENLCLGYGRSSVLSDINMEISSGEFWFLVGPNGAGKTTLLRGLLGGLRPRSGTISLHPNLQRHDKLGFVPQRCDLNQTLPMSVRAFVGLGAVGLRLGRREIAGRRSWALEQVGLSGMERRDYWSLSGGQRQRALVARALIRRPEFLLADEPTAGLDLAAKDALLKVIRGLNRQGLTVLFVTHDLSLAVRFGSHFAICKNGTIVSGAGEEILRSATLKSAYGIPVQLCRDVVGGLSVHIGSEDEQ